MKIHPLITTSEALADLCSRLAKADFITVDTEFMRENTYWPELCLIQIADSEEAAAIDPLAPGIDMGPLFELLTSNEDVLKVFHAGGQDVEIIYNFTGCTPHPIFDTQIAMMAISQSEQIGYSNLVESWLGIPVDKGARFTDWSRRPLTERQIEYAIGDVTHLAKIFPRMLAKLRKTGRGAWLDIEMEKLADPENYRNDPAKAWLRIKATGRNPAMLGRLKALGAWRENEAQDKNIPRGRIVRDETMADIASHPPKVQADLAKVRGLSTGWKDNEIGRRLMRPSRCPTASCPTGRRAAHRWARKGRWLPTYSSCCSRSAAARSTSPHACWHAARNLNCSLPGCAKGCRCSKPGASPSSVRMRSIWLRASWLSPWSRAGSRKRMLMTLPKSRTLCQTRRKTRRKAWTKPHPILPMSLTLRQPISGR